MGTPGRRLSMGVNGESIEVVSLRECGEFRREVDKRLDEIKMQQRKHEEDIVDLKIIAAKLEQIVQTLVDNEKSNKKVDVQKIWSQSWFKYFILTVCAIILLLTIGAISDNVIQHYIEITKGIPTK